MLEPEGCVGKAKEAFISAVRSYFERAVAMVFAAGKTDHQGMGGAASNENKQQVVFCGYGFT